MNSVESAASLFGSDDASPDPFAVLGDDSETTTDSTNAVHGETLSLDDKPDAGVAAAGLYGLEDSSASAQYSSELKSSSHDPYVYDTSAYSQDTSNGVSYNDQEVQGWYDEHGQWQMHQNLPTQPAEAAQDYATGQLQNAPSNSYDPYTPQASIRQAQSHAPQVPQTYHQQPSSTSSSGYTPLPSSSQAGYNQYTTSAFGSQTTSDQNMSYPYTGTGRSSYATIPQITPPAPTPPAPSAAAYRPKKSNAYDPPLPPPKSSRRAVSAARPTRTVSPAVGQQTYPLYNGSTLPQPPHPSAVYAPYSAPLNAQPYNSHAQSSSGGQENSATGSQHANPWGNHTMDNRYADRVSGDHVATNGVRESNKPSQYVSHSGLYAPSSPPKAPNGGKTDEPATPRQLPSMMVDNSGSQHAQSQIQSALSSQQSFGSLSYGQSHEWANTAMTGSGSPPNEVEDGYAAASPSASYTSQGSGQYPFSGNGIIKGYNRVHSRGSSTADRAGSPAQPISQPWSNSPRASPDIHHTRSPIAVSSSPPPSNHAYPYQREVFGKTSSPVNDFSHPWNDDVKPYGLSDPSTFTDVQREPSPAFVPNSTTYNPEGYAKTTADKPEKTDGMETYSALQGSVNPAVASDPYAPNLNARPPYGTDPKLARTPPPLNSMQSLQKAVSDPYAPHGKDISNGSVVSAVTAGRYPHPQHGAQESYGALQFGSSPSVYNHPNSQELSYEGLPYDSSFAQELPLAPPTRAPYAPSPSLMGLNDPLGRTSARIPVFSFGFGGKVVTCFHGVSALSTGFDVALSSRQSTDIQISVVHKVIPESALHSSSVVFPGPLFSDPGSPTNSLVRTTASQVKAKKARVSKYLDERAEEIHRGIAYLSPNSEDRRQADGRLVLVKLLKVMLEYDGQLSGTSQIDASVRAALLPRLAEVGPTSPREIVSTSSLSFSSPMSDSYSGLGLSASDSGEIPVAVSTLRPSALSKIQEFLLRGERRQAYHFALDEKLWAHAMIIASSIDKDAWKEVVNEFLRMELGMKDDGRRLSTLRKVNETPARATNGREWLRVAYSLFSGQGPAAVQELLPPNQLSRPTTSLQVSTLAVPHMTPMSPHFPSPAITANIPAESLSKWPETVAVMVSSPMAPDTSAALTALGDYLVSNDWIEAAHACYLLSPVTSPIGGVGSPSTRVVLLGSRSPHRWPNFHKDSDPIILSEIAEFAMSLAAPPKGQDPFHGLPHLQAYRFIRAMSLAEIGHVDVAKRYCEAITVSLGRNSLYFTSTLVDQLRGLSDRLTGAPHLEKSGSWIGGKMSKPSLDSIGGWLEGRLTKFIAGDGDTSPVPQGSAPANEPGVFTHYSTISSTTTSASPSPPPSQINTHTIPAPPRRSGSAMAAHSAASPYVQIDRASSAMEYSRPDVSRSSPRPRIASAHPSTTTFAQVGSFGDVVNGYGPANGHISNYSNNTVMSESSLDTTNEESQPPAATWWGSYGEESSAPTPTATTFVRIDDAPVPSSSGFISLMDDSSFSVPPSPPVSREPSSSYEDDDEEDLGFGNSKKHETKKPDVKSDTTSESVKTVSSEQPDVKPAQGPATSSSSGSWLGRFWRRTETTTPGPIKASLGEETSFYYDKEQKRWVNKKAGAAEESKPAAPPPPPSRSQTASPGRSNHMSSSSSSSSLAPPPARSASAIDLSVSPPNNKSALRVRSNLVPQESKSSPSTPMPPGLGLPPTEMGRPKSSASKRNIRSRYVDILQDGGAK